jgi:Arc/MetJ-type ribon-helix-helix transcriptional regulator
MAQLVTRVDDELVAQVDALIAAGVVDSRSEAVRLGLARLVDRHIRDETGRRIADAYRSRPQSAEELEGVDEATQRMLTEESW